MNYNLATLKLFSNFLTCNLPDQRLRKDIKKKCRKSENCIIYLTTPPSTEREIERMKYW